jgi:hypothetical protein
LRPEPLGGLYDGRKPVRPVVAAPGEAAHRGAFPANQEAESVVVLYFVHPGRPGRRLRGPGGRVQQSREGGVARSRDNAMTKKIGSCVRKLESN